MESCDIAESDHVCQIKWTACKAATPGKLFTSHSRCKLFDSSHWPKLEKNDKPKTKKIPWTRIVNSTQPQLMEEDTFFGLLKTSAEDNELKQMAFTVC